MDRRARGKGSLGVLCAGSVALAGCVASIREVPSYGPARPTPGAGTEWVTERRNAIEGWVECRDLAVTAPMQRDVEIRRTFADRAQEQNAAVLVLMAAGLGALQFTENKLQQCPQTGTVCEDFTKATYATLALAAIPLAFVTLNALAVRDRRVVEPAPPEAKAGPWHTCSE